MIPPNPVRRICFNSSILAHSQRYINFSIIPSTCPLVHKPHSLLTLIFTPYAVITWTHREIEKNVNARYVDRKPFHSCNIKFMAFYSTTVSLRENSVRRRPLRDSLGYSTY